MSKESEKYEELTYGGTVNRIRDGIELTKRQKETMEKCGLTVEDFINQPTLEEKIDAVNAFRCGETVMPEDFEHDAINHPKDWIKIERTSEDLSDGKIPSITQNPPAVDALDVDITDRFMQPGKIAYTPIQFATLRDQFAMAALQGLLASCDGPAWGNQMFPVAESAYAYADQMIAERNK